MIFLFLAILISFSACKINSNNTDIATSNLTPSVEFNVPESDEYNASSTDTEAIKINDILYRNNFQGELNLQNQQHTSEAIFENEFGCFCKLNNTKFDIIYNVNSETVGIADSVYCRDDQWQTLNSYYSDSKNFSYQCIIRQKGSDSQTYTVKKMDIDKLNRLVEFCNANSYNPTAVSGSVVTRAVSSLELDDLKYKFTMSSNDGLFSAETASFYIVDNKLVLEYYNIMSEDKILIVDVPDELSQYFVSIINEL